MEERDRRGVPDAGLLGCDREVFAQVWGRVAPGGGGLVEPVAAPRESAPDQDRAEPAVAELGGEDRDAGRLRELVLGLLSDASVYRGLIRRTRRSVAELQELHQIKLRQAKRASAAYFLLTGVRYWPRDATPVDPPESFFPALRQRFLAERRLADRLAAMAGECREGELAELWGGLARETADLVRTIRYIVERET